MSLNCNRKRTVFDEADRLRQRYLSIKDAAVYLGCGIWGVRKLIWDGLIPVIRIRRKMFLDIKDLDRLMQQNKEIYS